MVMDPLGTMFDKFKSFTKSSQDFFGGLIHGHRDSPSRNPIEILKRLQREAFSDLMKLRDRQDKVEKMLSFYKPSKGGPFQEATTHVRGQVDLLGALLMMDNINQHNLDVISRAGIRTGVESRLIFETNLRQKDTLIAEFVVSQSDKEHHSDVLGSPLSLSKLGYKAKFSDWLSVLAIPMGAQCKDVGIASNSFHQGKGLTDVSSVGPPLLNLHNGSAIGIMVRKSNIVASLAQFVSGLGMQLGSNANGNCSSTFGELMYEFPGRTKLSLLGLHQVPLSSSEHTKLGPLTIPILLSKRHEVSETEYDEAFPGLETKRRFSSGSIALIVESELDDISKIGGWVEMSRLNQSVQWGVSMCDVSEDSFGWGMNLNGMIGNSASGDLFQAESYLKFNMGGKFCLKPGIAYVTDGHTKLAGLMLRSSWSF